MAPVSIRNIYKRYGKLEALHGVSLEIGDGDFVVLVGPSGCGKSTTLRMIAGLEVISQGEIAIGGRVVNNLEPKDRNIAMVFQNYAIYPHMTVYRNIGFGLYSARLSNAEKDRRIREAAAILDLSVLLDRRPAELSGGQRQRVAIGRAMVRDPSVFLFDEPLSNLDAQLRAQMRVEIKKLHQNLGSTIIFVTHDQVEAMTLADRIVIMKDGYIQQIGTPTDVYQNPANMFVAQFIGSPSMNLLSGRALGGNRVELDGIGEVALSGHGGGGLTGQQRVVIGVRPDDLLVVAATPPGHFGLAGRVSVVEPLGPEVIVYVDVEGKELIAKSAGRQAPSVGSTVTIAAPADELHVFDAQSERALR
ncbi:MAG: sn-glycerol-3-phosphate ABC transporter ATP-binding protein UgpC [Bauldia sp.]